MRRTGSALVVTLLALLLLGLLTAGALVVATADVTSARLHARALQVRLSAESAIRAVTAEWASARFDTLQAFRAIRIVVPDADSVTVSVEAVGSGRFILHASHPIDAASPRAAALVTTLPPDSLRTLFGAALRARGNITLGPNADVDGSADPSVPCEATSPAVPGVRIAADASMTSSPLARVNGSPPVRTDAPDTFALQVAGLPLSSLARLADFSVSGSVRPAPAATSGFCDREDIANWGDPSSSGECREFLPLLFAPGDLTVDGGVAQGTLIVLGTLTLRGGALVHGAVLAGQLAMADATVIGAVHVFGMGTTDVDATIRYSACALERAFQTRALRAPFRMHPRWWLPPR